MSLAKKRGSINLTALGSAAVVAVYAAGYLRTRSAAQRYERGDSERRPVAAAAPARMIDSAKLMDAVLADTLRPTARVPVPATPAPPAPKQKKTPLAAVVVSKLPVAPPPSDSTPSNTPAAPPIAAPVDAAKPTADSLKAVKVLKDGTYTGWGTSRHGDIEAAVEIQDGRIVKAYITQCLTRYSCSRIASIVPQVVERQSAEVDYVSGATQSTDAFYYAIVGALAKAK